MVRGIESFKKWFSTNDSQYVIIGGTACDILMNHYGLDFRSTKDIDIVLIIEAIDKDFGMKFWEYIELAEYKHCKKSSSIPEFYRFVDPKSSEFPQMIELFTRKLDSINLPNSSRITPLPIDDDISSLSAILLNDDYYDLLNKGKKNVDGLSVLSAEYLILFKIKAWLDLTYRKNNGETIDSKNIKKHKNDVFRLYELVNPSITISISSSILKDVRLFIEAMENEDINIKDIGLKQYTKNQILDDLENMFILETNQ